METGSHANEVLKRVDKKEVTPYEPPDRYLSVIERLASDPNVDIDKLQKIIDMKNREEDRSAEQAYNADMVLAQEEIKVAIKNRTNQQTRSNYADLCALIVSAKPIYTKHGFALSFYQGENSPEGYIRVMMDIMHREGHSKTRFRDIPADLTGIAGKVNKTKVHGEASSFSYGRRYLIAESFNVPTGDDDDGNAAGGQTFIEGTDLDHIKKLVSDVVSNEKAFLKVAGAKSVDEIPVQNQNKVLALLNKKKVQMAKKEAEKQVEREPGEEG